MIYSDTNQQKLEANESAPVSDGRGVPHAVAEAFWRGLDDVKYGRVVDGDAVIAEGRALLTEYREKNRKDGSSFADGA